MPLLDAVHLALAQIRVQKLKSFFTILGVTIGVMFLIAVVSIVEGMNDYMEHDFAARLLGVNTFTLRRFAYFNSGHVTEATWHAWQRRPRFYYADVPLIRSALPAGARWAVESDKFLSGSTPYARTRQVEAHAVDGDYFAIRKYDLARGRTFTAQEESSGALVMVIGDEVAKYFFPGLEPIGRELRVGALPYQVIGVIERQGSIFGLSQDRMAIAPFASPLHRLTNPRGDVDGILVQAMTPLLLDDAMESVREVLRGKRKLRPSDPDNFVMETSATALSWWGKMKGIMTIVGTALPGIGLVVGGMVIMNIMLVAVAERTREIGIRKALGARQSDILKQFLVEAATLSTCGAIIGIVLGIVAAKIIASASPLPAAIAPWSVFAATGLGLTVGIVSGVYPACRAARLDPIAALRQE